MKYDTSSLRRKPLVQGVSFFHFSFFFFLDVGKASIERLRSFQFRVYLGCLRDKNKIGNTLSFLMLRLWLAFYAYYFSSYFSSNWSLTHSSLVKNKKKLNLLYHKTVASSSVCVGRYNIIDYRFAYTISKSPIFHTNTTANHWCCLATGGLNFP